MSTSNAPWWIALVAWMGASTYWHVCEVKELCDTPLVESAGTKATGESLYIADGINFTLRAEGNLTFASSGAVPNLDPVRTELDSLASYLSSAPDRQLTILGYYSATETNSTAYPDLGIARAESIKQYLVSQGLLDSLIVTGSQMMGDAGGIDADSVYGGIAFEFTRIVPATEEGLANAQKYLGLFRPMDLYFPSGESDYIKTEANGQFVMEAQKYLAVHPDKQLLLTGHTDSDGDADGNVALAKAKAEAVKKQLVREGIAASQLKVDAKGESEPKESNKTPAGKRANRRVTIVVQ